MAGMGPPRQQERQAPARKRTRSPCVDRPPRRMKTKRTLRLEWRRVLLDVLFRRTPFRVLGIKDGNPTVLGLRHEMRVRVIGLPDVLVTHPAGHISNRDTTRQQSRRERMPQAMRPETSGNSRTFRWHMELRPDSVIHRIDAVITRAQRTLRQILDHSPQPAGNDHITVFPALTALQRTLRAAIPRCLPCQPQNPRATEILTMHADSLFNPQPATPHQPHHDPGTVRNPLNLIVRGKHEVGTFLSAARVLDPDIRQIVLRQLSGLDRLIQRARDNRARPAPHGDVQMTDILGQQVSDPVTITGYLRDRAAVECLLDPRAGRHPVAALGGVRHRVPVNPGIHSRAEVLPAQLVIHEDLSPRVVISLDLEVLSLLGSSERALPLPAVDPVPYGVRLALVLALDDHRHSSDSLTFA